MPEERVIEEIKKAINDREKTDRIMSFGVYFVILVILYIIAVLGWFSRETAVLYFGLILAIIFYAYIFYSLIKREEHFKRERKLLSNLILWFEGKIDESRISNLRKELTDRENEEEEKHPIIWSILTFIPFLGLYTYYFLMKDFYRHDKREIHVLRYIHNAMESAGTVFLIPMKSKEIPKRKFVLYAILTVLTLGIFGMYFLFKDPNIHFEYQKEWEDRLLEAIQTPIVITRPPSDVNPSDVTKVYDETETLLNAELILPQREIEINQNENIFGRSDFESDLSEEYLSYITNKEGERYHFKIIREDGTFYIQDDNSTNGTKLNDIEIKGRGKKELENGDKIILAEINNFTITFKIIGA